MAKYYQNKKTNMTIVSGTVKEISDDGKMLMIASAEYDRNEKKNVEKVVEVNSQFSVYDTDDSISVGKVVTAIGAAMPNMKNPTMPLLQAMSVTSKANVYEYSTLSVVSGEVVFAGYNEEKNDDGTPKMTQARTIKKSDGQEEVSAPHAKKPHFDIGIQVKEPDGNGGEKRVLHTMKLYAFKDDTTQIERTKKIFANFDKETNPIYATIVTQPGQEYSYTKTVGDNEYTNFCSSHMGIQSLDVEFIKGREMAKTSPSVEAKPEVKEENPFVQTEYTKTVEDEDIDLFQ